MCVRWGRRKQPPSSTIRSGSGVLWFAIADWPLRYGKAMSLEHILDIAFAFRKSKALLSAVELRLFDVLADSPQSAHELTDRLRLHGRGARDFLDALVALKLLDRDEDERYSNAPTCSTYLDPRQPTYIGGLLEYLNARMYRTWDYLT